MKVSASNAPAYFEDGSKRGREVISTTLDTSYTLFHAIFIENSMNEHYCCHFTNEETEAWPG